MTNEKNIEFLRRFTYEAGDGVRFHATPTNVLNVLGWINTNFVEIGKIVTHSGTKRLEEMERYELDLRNHKAYCNDHLKFAETVIELVKQFGPERATEKVKNVISEMRFIDAPNKPGYYRANND